MSDDLPLALDRCLTWLRSGIGVESCLARYPEYADQLRPLLDLASHMSRAAPAPPPAAGRAAGRRGMLSAYAQKRRRQKEMHPVARLMGRVLRPMLLARPGGIRPAWQATILILAIALAMVGGIVVTASADSLPGDALYPVKLASQRAQLALTFDTTRHELLRAEFSTQQRSAVRAVLKAGSSVDVEFQGVLQEMSQGLWIVGGLSVTVTGGTEILGEPYLGALVRVRGHLPGDGLLLASQVFVESTLPPWTIVTPERAETAELTETPDLTETPEPASSVVPTASVEPAGTYTPSRPTVIPEPSMTPVPTAGARASAAPDSDREVESSGEPSESGETPEQSDGTESDDGPDETAELIEPEQPDHPESPDGTELPDSDDDADTENPETPEPDNDGDTEDSESPEPDDEADGDADGEESESPEKEDHDDDGEREDEPEE